MTTSAVALARKTELDEKSTAQRVLARVNPKLPAFGDFRQWRYRDDISFMSEGVRVQVSRIACCMKFDLAYDYCVHIKIDKLAGFLFLESGLVEKIVARLAPDSLENFTGKSAALLLELALVDAIGRIEQVLGRMISLVGVERPPVSPILTPASGLMAIEATVVVDQVSTRARLDLCKDGIELLQKLLIALPFKRLRINSFPIPISFEVGRAVLSLAELRSLELGDAIILGRDKSAVDEVSVVVSDFLCARAKRNGCRISLLEPLSRRERAMNNGKVLDNSKAANDAIDLEEMEVGIAFEIGRKTVTISELETFSPGYIFELCPDIMTQVDITSQGRRIGRGEIVEIGDKIGVRLIEIFRRG